MWTDFHLWSGLTSPHKHKTQNGNVKLVKVGIMQKEDYYEILNVNLKVSVRNLKGKYGGSFMHGKTFV